MRILMSAVGTRGDVQPVLALALEARELGNEVRLCVPPNFVREVESLGFEARPLGIEMRAPRRGEGAPPAIPDLITEQFEVVHAAAQECDLIIGGGAHQYAARSVAERMDIPCVIAVYAPISIPTAELPPPGQTDLPGRPADNGRLWDENRLAWNARSLEKVNSNRKRWNLEPITDVLSHILGNEVWLAADAALGRAPSNLNLDVFQSGAWVLKDTRPLPEELSTFLTQGEPPIYFGFGSMPAPQSTVAILTGAARALGRRMILLRGWAELDPIDEGPDCIIIDEVNQQALFPKVAAVVHHGGAGTTVVAAHAGAPQLAVPMFSDQFYWGFRLQQLKVGVATPMASLDAETLVDALRQVLVPETASTANALAHRISTDGASVAARRLKAFER